ncbi:uncharacterized protein LOC118312411 [Scophthalmus maximus]|uniref:uncharacterized protein LOC118312411 n=1 Tax=Scophthalmus maximus TaxID=52904 RepID=UPI0015E159E7|nr:uncharacterized protein LOC118312411 [Scophthalmus maximus]
MTLFAMVIIFLSFLLHNFISMTTLSLPIFLVIFLYFWGISSDHEAISPYFQMREEKILLKTKATCVSATQMSELYHFGLFVLNIRGHRPPVCQSRNTLHLRWNLMRYLIRYLMRYIRWNLMRYLMWYLMRYIRWNLMRYLMRYIRWNLMRYFMWYLRWNLMQYLRRYLMRYLRRYLVQYIRPYLRWNLLRYLRWYLRWNLMMYLRRYFRWNLIRYLRRYLRRYLVQYLRWYHPPSLRRHQISLDSHLYVHPHRDRDSGLVVNRLEVKVRLWR